MQICRRCAVPLPKNYIKKACEACLVKARVWDKTKWQRNRDLPKTKLANKLRHRAWVAANPEKQRARVIKWKLLNRDKNKVHTAVKDAVRRGHLIRPGKCSKCKKCCKPEAHHKNYKLALKVMWLCRPCHVTLHTKERRAT